MLPKFRLNSAYPIALTGCLLALSACGLIKAPRVMLPSIAQPKAAADEVVVALSPTDTHRPENIHFTFDANGKPNFGQPEEEKLVRGDLTVDNGNGKKEQMSFFLPMFGPHPLTSSDKHSYQNTSTLISVDSKHNGQLERNEQWWTTLPIRLGDRMFDVRAIDPGSKWILLRQSQAKLAGAVVGKHCPDFSFTTTDGKPVSLAGYKGKWLLLDVWSMT